MTPINNYMNCRKCSSPLSPQKRQCTSCHSVQSPWFNRVLPWFLGILAIAALIGGIIGGIEENELNQALSVMIPITAVIIVTSIGLFRGSKVAWYVWTVLLGMAVFGCTAILIDDGGGPFLLLFLVPTLVYLGVTLRTNMQKSMRTASLTYLVVILVVALIDSSALGLLLPTAGLVVWTYSIPVRWWYNIGKSQS